MKKNEEEERGNKEMSSDWLPGPVFVIGSSSKWRLGILRPLLTDPLASPCGVPVPAANILQISPDIDEKSIRRDAPDELVLAICMGKLDAVCRQLGDRWNTDKLQKTLLERNVFVFCSDQVAVFGPHNEIREKPTDAAENRRFIESYRHSSIRTVAGYVVQNLSSGTVVADVGTTETFFGDIPDDVIDRLIERGESMICCGGFVVDDVDLGKCVLRIDGNVEQVSGIHREIVADLVRRAAS